MLIERVVVGMDFSAPAIAGARWVARHLAPRAELTLVHVIDLPPQPGFLRGPIEKWAVYEEDVPDYAATRLREVANLVSGREARTVVRSGRAHQELTRAAEDSGADLIVIGPHGDGPHDRRLLGTTADRVVRLSSIPVLIAARVSDAPPRRVLAPVDGSEITSRVLEYARDVSGSSSAELTLLHVLSNAAYSHIASMAAVTTRDAAAAAAKIDEVMRDEATRWLGSLQGSGARQPRPSARVVFGKAGEEILAVARAEASDLIVIGRSGTGVVRETLLGSTVRTVLHDAPCPVLVVTGLRESERDGG